jgi:hypothetical protein
MGDQARPQDGRTDKDDIKSPRQNERGADRAIDMNFDRNQVPDAQSHKVNVVHGNLKEHGRGRTRVPKVIKRCFHMVGGH